MRRSRTVRAAAMYQSLPVATSGNFPATRDRFSSNSCLSCSAPTEGGGRKDEEVGVTAFLMRLLLCRRCERRSQPGVVDRVEQQLERAVRLRALENLRTEEDRLALPDRGLERDDAVAEVALAPRPPTAQRRFAVEP